MNQSSHFPRSRVMVFGGYGVFGSLVSRELAQRGVPVTIAGRDGRKAEALAREIGGPCAGVEADLADGVACGRLLHRHSVVVNCAGPFSEMNAKLLLLFLDHGCHYVDLADDRAYVAQMREYHERFSRARLTAAYGCSSLPSISLALAQHVCANGKPAESAPEAAPDVGLATAKVDRVRVGLFIGQDNAKGIAAVRSAVRLLGRRIAAPQGELVGFRDRTLVPLPPPLGPRPMLNFESPDYDLLPKLLGAREVIVQVGFESRLVMAAFEWFARRAPQAGQRLLPMLAAMSQPLRRFGTSCGVVFVELDFADGSHRSAALVAERDGQRMAALPCVYVAQRLVRGKPSAAGVWSGGEILGPSLLERLVWDGFSLCDEPPGVKG